MDEASRGTTTRDAFRAYVKLNRATRAVLSFGATRVAQAGLTLTQVGVLEAVLHKGAMHQRELGRKVLTSAGRLAAGETVRHRVAPGHFAYLVPSGWCRGVR